MVDTDSRDCPSERPQWHSRLTFASTLIDLNQFDSASEVLESLIEENDQDIQIWHLMACKNIASKEFDSAVECIQTAMEVRVNKTADGCSPSFLTCYSMRSYYPNLTRKTVETQRTRFTLNTKNSFPIGQKH